MNEFFEANAPDPHRRRQRLIVGSLVVAFIVLIALAVGASLAWNAAVSSAVSASYSEYIVFVERSQLDEATRGRLITRLTTLRDRAADGDHPGFSDWIAHNESIRGLIADEEITEADLISLEKELNGLENGP